MAGNIQPGCVPLGDSQAFVPQTPEECNTIRQELERILSSPLFQNSRRYPNLLRYVVDQALQGNTDLKERVLGIEVFGRPCTYDVNTDPVVRITASEVRKRLAQYYHHLDRASEIQIELPTGAYTPEFRRRVAHPPVSSPGEGSSPELFESSLQKPVPVIVEFPLQTRKHKWVYAAALLVLVFLSGLLVGRVLSPKQKTVAERTASFERFWAPIVTSPDQVVICIGGAEPAPPWNPGNAPEKTSKGNISNQPPVAPNTASQSPSNPFDRSPTVVDTDPSAFVGLSDINALIKTTSVLQAHGKNFRLVASANADLATLRGGPVVLLGLYNNRWTMKVLEKLRFYPTPLPDMHFAGFFDRQNPTRTDWQVSRSTSPQTMSKDFAIVARLKDATTGRPVILVAGLGGQGSIAASEFIASPAYIDSLLKDAPPNWQDLNLEAVIETQVIEGETGPPRVIAVYYW
jgi:hypothetical protein